MAHGLTPAERDRMVASLESALAAVRDAEVTTDCRDCAHFESPDHCGMWKAKIPPSAMQQGCDAWEEGVPF
ncbi:MAG: hypothetical protein NXI11_05845 [Proteobacteria bacterium]|nr:hypothetical protein [Pseudomonadota bacterium]